MTDRITIALTQLREALVAREERVHQLHTLRGDKTTTDNPEEDA